MGITAFRYEGYPFNAGQLEDHYCDLKRQKARSRRLRLQKPEAFMLQGVPPYVDTRPYRTLFIHPPFFLFNAVRRGEDGWTLGSTISYLTLAV